MPFSTAGKNLCLGALPGTVYISGHTADPGDTGASEIAGGNPAYARKSATLAAANSGSRALSTQPVLDIPAGTTLAFLGVWDSLNGGTYLGDYNAVDEVYAGQGTYTVTSGSLSIT